jgi:hypothetical protein
MARVASALCLAFSISSQAASVTYDLTLSNDTTGNILSGTPYAQVTIDDEGAAGLINFTVSLLPSLLTANAGTNFGLQSFGFNVASNSGLSAIDIINLPNSDWSAIVSYNPPSSGGTAQNGFGKFDAVVADGGQSRVNPTLTFSIDVAGDSIADYIAASSGGHFFAAHITGFADLNPLAPADDPYDGTGACYDTTGQGDFTAACNILTSVWVAGSTPTVVPVPTAAWLFGSGLLGLAGIARRRKRSS